jgi:hypothetical protein
LSINLLMLTQLLPLVLQTLQKPSQRVGSSAAQSGVSLNELIAIVTSAQQTTARGGAVIGNSFKTIFTRLQRGKVVEFIRKFGHI